MSTSIGLRVSENCRFLVHDDGSPFFYLGDTAWELFHRLDRPGAEEYLRIRAAQGFTVIQAVVLAEFDGLTAPNAYGALPLESNDPTQPIEKYFEHVDWIVSKAAEFGLRIGMLPTWGDKWNKAWAAGPEIFTPENARIYGEWLGHRYREQPSIWILGGDRAVENDTHRAIIRAMSEGLRAGDGGAHLQTLHPMGRHGSAEAFHDDNWLAFNMRQTGHSRLHENWKPISEDYALAPTKPILDAEPGYENHPSAGSLDNGRMDAYDVRRFAYWSLFAGACGHTYGCHDIWAFYETHRTPVNGGLTPWREAIHFAGARQMQHAKKLLLSRPFLSRVPDQSLIVDEAGDTLEHAQATRDQSGSYAMIYLASGREITIDTSKLLGQTLRVWWFDPRSGVAQRGGEQPRQAQTSFTPPIVSRGSDWVLVLDDAARNFAAPGQLSAP